MRLSRPSGLGGLGLSSCSGGTAQPAAKRQKRADVLGSLGLDRMPAGGSSIRTEKRGSSSKSLASAVSGLSGSDHDKEALRQWLSGEEPKQNEEPEQSEEPKQNGELLPHTAHSEKTAEMPAEGSLACSKSLGKFDETWRRAFNNASDRWDVDVQPLHGYYFESEQKLFFEWDQENGILYQYLFDAGTGSDERTAHASEGRLPERAPVWSADCPETHAEVWDVLPLPPTDPAAMARELQQDKLQDEADVASKPALLDTSASPADLPPTTSSCPPPLAVTKKRPPVPSMAAMSACAPRAQDNVEPQLPGEADVDVPGTVMLGCAPPASSSSSSYPREVEDVEDEVDDGSRPPILDDEDIADLASEDCALPQAPAERPLPSATDLDLDIFGGLDSG